MVFKHICMYLFALFIFLQCPGLFAARMDGTWHKVRKKETLWRISYNYRVSMKKIMIANKIKDPAKIKSGEWLFIPGISKSGSQIKISTSEKPGKILRYPVTGRVLNSFRKENNDYYNGIDIETSEREKVRAALSGVVKFTGEIRGYGKVIIVTHNNELTTVYACLKEISVNKNTEVKSGQVLGRTGRLFNKGKPALHFQLIKNGKPVNPVPYFK